jgi:hypothetical protein
MTTDALAEKSQVPVGTINKILATSPSACPMRCTATRIRSGTRGTCMRRIYTRTEVERRSRPQDPAPQTPNQPDIKPLQARQH